MTAKDFSEVFTKNENKHHHADKKNGCMEMTEEQQISLRTIYDRDIPAIECWLNREHVRKWFGEPQTWLEEINAKHGWIHYYIVEYENIPIGFCQYYDCR